MYNSSVAFELRSGGLIRLRLHRGGALGWAAPIWAVLCGAVASGRVSLDPSDGVRLLLTLLLAESGWGGLWAALATTDWATPLRRWCHWHLEPSPPRLPYAQPGSPGDRLARWLSQLWAWSRAVLIPSAGRPLGTAIAGLILSSILAAALGWRLAALTIGALAFMQLAVTLNRGQGQPGAVWDGPLRLGLPWLAGHLTFAPLSMPSVALAAAFSMTLAGLDRTDRPSGRNMWVLGQVIASTVLIPLHRALAIPFLALFLVPQILLSTSAPYWTGRAWVWLAASMLVTAWAL